MNQNKNSTIQINMSFNRNLSQFVILLPILLLSSCKNSPETLPQPNILIMIADDMGYGDLECYGGISNTPNLNKLAKNGFLFTDFYAAASNCSPSRVGLLTGRSPARAGSLTGDTLFFSKIGSFVLLR